MLADVDYFELFELDRTYDIDLNLLEKKFKDLQKVIHPDNFAKFNDDELVEKSHVYSAYVNDGYEILKNDFERAKYILGDEMPEDQMIDDFEMLTKIMEIREQIEFAGSNDELVHIKAVAQKERDDMVQKISYLLAHNHKDDAKEWLIKLRYHSRILEAIYDKEHQFI